MIPHPSTVQLGDGRVVGVYEYGEPAGAPVLTFHGVPSCGAGFTFTDEAARQRGLRVIAPDRPGIGLSTRGDWTIASYPAQVDALADALGVDRFAVFGYSGGGPYAVACAALLGERITKAAIGAGMGQIGVWAEPSDFETTDRQMLEMAPKHPRLARLILGGTAKLARLSPKSAVKSFAKQLSESDRQVLASYGSPKEAIALFTEAFTHGAHGVVADYLAVGQPWGVDLAAITAPVRIYQGDADTMVPARHASELAARIDGSDLVPWPGEGHLGVVTHIDEVLDWLAA